jgi:hypothetical protein
MNQHEKDRLDTKYTLSNLFLQSKKDGVKGARTIVFASLKNIDLNKMRL